VERHTSYVMHSTSCFCNAHIYRTHTLTSTRNKGCVWNSILSYRYLLWI